MVRARHAAILALSLLVAAGCGGGYSHLPQPRLPDDDEEVAASPPRSSAPESAGPPQSPPPAPPVTSPPPVETSAATASAKPAPAAGAAVPAAKEAAAAAGPLDGRKRTLDQLQQIGRLFDSFRGQGSNYHTYPGPYTLPNLSWRVVILSYLEQYEELAGSFRKEEPWDGPHNRRSLRKIPDLFQPPQRQDEKTHLVLVTGPGTIYEDGRQARASSCSDGLEETILAVAVDDAFAVPWTSSQDYAFRPETVHQAFFGLYKDCCYALFGGSTGVRRIPATISDEHLLALITPDGGEAVSALDVTRLPTPEPDEELLQYLKEHPVVRFAKQDEPAAKMAVVAEAKTVGKPAAAAVVAAPAPPANPAAKSVAKSDGSGEVSISATADGRLPVPDEVSQQLARRTLREAHHEQYATAKTDDRKKELADKLLARARSSDLDPAGRYVALELSRKIAIEIGDIPKALESLELTTQGFQTEGHAEKAEILVSSIGLPLSENDNDLVLSEARKWMETALQKNEFDLAERFLNAALSAARRTRDVNLIGALTARKKEIADARTAWLEVADYIDLLLQHPTHPQANEIVGTYYCLVKQRWEDGLPLLARAADPRLVELAVSELKRPAAPPEQVALADRWWTFAEGDVKHKLAVRARAAYWYREALGGLPPGLERIKAESRLAKADAKPRLGPSPEDQ